METLYQQPDSLYTGRYMKLYERRSILKRKPWWTRYRWTRWLFGWLLKWFSTVYKGFCIDGKSHLSLQNSFMHYLIVGQTGSGKTACSVIPTLLNLEGQSAVVTDPGELYEKTSGWLAKNGYDVRLINLADPTRSDLFNQMDFTQDLSTIRRAVGLLIRSAFPGSSTGNEQFWNQNAESLIIALWDVLVNQPDPRYRNVANLRYLLLHFGTDGSRLLEVVAKYASPESFDEFRAFLQQDPKIIQNTLSTAKTALALFSDPAIAQLTAMTTFDPRQLRKQKTIVFIKTPEGEMESYSYLIKVLYAEIFKVAMQEPEKGDLPIMFLLEEFANCGVALLPEFVNIITTIRKKRCSICMVVQDIQQMNHLLGAAKTTSIVEGGTANVLYLPKQSLETARRLEQIIGMTARSFTDLQGQRQEANRAVVTADEIMTIPHNAAIFHHSGRRPALLQLFPYHYERRLRRRSQMPPAEIRTNQTNEPVVFYPLPEVKK